MLFDFADGRLSQLERTTFQQEDVLERAHLQAALARNISVLGSDLLVVAEEYGDFEGAYRRIDLLCLDQAARLVVVELKRTEDGGHMELQALRYAAMVSVMTFDQLVRTYAAYRRRLGPTQAAPPPSTAPDLVGAAPSLEAVTPVPEEERARDELIAHLDLGAEAPVISRDVRIILVSAGFSNEITTTVLWLVEQYDLDITCMRMTPYRHQGRLLLDVQQVIPLPEAQDFIIRLKERETAVRDAAERNTGVRLIYSVNGIPGLEGRRSTAAGMLREIALHVANARGLDTATIDGFTSPNGDTLGSRFKALDTAHGTLYVNSNLTKESAQTGWLALLSRLDDGHGIEISRAGFGDVLDR